MRQTMRGRILFGTLLLAAGTAWILDLQGIELFPGGFSTWWPALLIVWGIGSFIVWPRRRVRPLMSISLGSLMLADKLGYLPAPWWAYLLPALLVLMGIAVFVGIHRARKATAAMRAAQAAAYAQYREPGQRVFIDVENEANKP